MSFFSGQIIINITLLSASLLFVLLWGLFFFFYSPKKTTPGKIIFISFIFGVFAACLAFLAETFFLSFLKSDIFSLGHLFEKQKTLDLYTSIFASVFFLAAIEELIKFVILRQYLKISEVNQVVDGIKIGLWLGLGFVFIENTFYFLNFYSQINEAPLLLGIILLRGIFSTLAHALYGAIMGYYLSLAKFNKFYQFYFLQKGFLTNLIIHGFFNFFLIINLGIFSNLILICILLFTLSMYSVKQNLEEYVRAKGKELIFQIPMSDRIEIETLLSKINASAEYFRQLLKIFPQKRSKN